MRRLNQARQNSKPSAGQPAQSSGLSGLEVFVEGYYLLFQRRDSFARGIATSEHLYFGPTCYYFFVIFLDDYINGCLEDVSVRIQIKNRRLLDGRLAFQIRA